MRIKIAVLLVLAMAAAAFAQTADTKTAGKKIEKVPVKYTSPASGQQMFESYCASCHGKDAKGSGPAASAMKTPVPDLTQLAKNNKGEFPSAHVYQVIKGDSAVPAHGSKDMPVWGPVLSHLSASSTQMEGEQRLHNLTNYIGKLQQK